MLRRYTGPYEKEKSFIIHAGCCSAFLFYRNQPERIEWIVKQHWGEFQPVFTRWDFAFACWKKGAEKAQNPAGQKTHPVVILVGVHWHCLGGTFVSAGYRLSGCRCDRCDFFHQPHMHRNLSCILAERTDFSPAGCGIWPSICGNLSNRGSFPCEHGSHGSFLTGADRPFL